MLRNDYRRSLILLRSNAAGYSGHVRLERRTLTGSMFFTLQTPDENASLKAALIGKNRDGSCFACPLGDFRRDQRGQTVLSLNFDPRNICGRELEDYKLIAVLETGGEQCSLVLFGNVNGHSDIDWSCALSAACALYDRADTTESVLVLPEAEMQAQPEIIPEAAEEEIPAPEEMPEPEEIIEEKPQENAGDALGIDMDIPWPQPIENLREMFKNAARLTDAPDSEHIYISAPMPEGSGYVECAVGIQVENGAPAFVCYALPALYSPEPPEGLEDYVWQGDANRGWWRFDGAADTGKRI